MNIGLVMRRSLKMNQSMVPAVFSLVLAISACGKQEQHLAPATGSADCARGRRPPNGRA